MARNGGEDGDSRMRLLIAKGSFAPMGGAERDIIRNLPSLSKRFSLSVATLESSAELESVCREIGVQLMLPSLEWSKSNSVFSRVLDSDFYKALDCWKSIAELIDGMGELDCVHITSGDGSLAILEIIPDDIAVHLHLLEPHRGLHEDVLHRGIDGSPKRNLGVTKAALTLARRRDLATIRELSARNKSFISGNSEFTSSRIGDVYGVRSGILPPSLGVDEFTQNPSTDEPSKVDGPTEPYVVTIGKASWVKGTWETISMLEGSGHSLALVGGGDSGDLDALIGHAKDCGVGLWIAPRLSSVDLCSIIRGAVAVVSMAHSEPFGLTPIEAQTVGTPALFVDEGGFRETISDGKSGRLLPRGDYSAWHDALKEAVEEDTRSEWAENGRKNISMKGLNPDRFSERLEDIFIGVSNV